MENKLALNITNTNNTPPIDPAKPQGAAPSTCPVSENSIYSGNIRFTSGVAAFSDTSKLQNPQDRQMYNELSACLGREGKSNLDSLLKTGKLLSRNSDDGSSTLENLYKIMKEPRAKGLDNGIILNETLRTLVNPFLINQKFGKIPDFMVPAILANEKRNAVATGLGLDNKLAPQFNQAKYVGPISAINREDLNVVTSGTCPAASIEFNLADKKPAEYARYVAGLSSPEMDVKVKLKFDTIATNILEAIEFLKMFKVQADPIDWNNVEVTLRPDNNSIIRAGLQEKNYKPGTRSSIDELMQSTFMQLGSENTYNSLTDKKHSEFNQNDSGLTEFEKNFVETLVDYDTPKISMTYQITDENAYLTGYTQDFATTQKQLVNALKSGSDVVLGITATDKHNKIIGGHEITVFNYKVDKNGELYFLYQDSDDDYDGPVKIKASELIPKIHHAGIPTKVLDLSHQPDSGYVLLNDFETSRAQNNAKKPPQQKK